MNTEKNRKLRGSVLLTVVFVMSILIVFLFGTLALALAANNRAHVNYSSAQTGITARAVAESAIKAISDKTPQGVAYSNAIEKLGPGETKSVSVELSSDNANFGTMGHIDDVVISYAGTKLYYDGSKEQWQERDLLKFTANVTMSGVTSTSSVYVLKHERADTEETAKNGAGFVTVSGAELNTQTSILGGAYINLPTPEQAWKYNDLDRIAVNKTFKAFDKSDASTYLNMQNSGGFVEADLYVNDNFYVNNLSAFYFPSEGTGITIWGDMIFNDTSDKVKYEASPDLRAISPDPYVGTSPSIAFNKMPYIFVNGLISDGSIINSTDTSSWVEGGGTLNLGNPNSQFPLNVFCGSLHSYKAKFSGLAADLYCMDGNGTTALVSQNATVLKSWTASVINKAKSSAPQKVVGGSIYTKGNLVLENFAVAGDVYVEGDCIFGTGVKIGGNLVVGRELKMSPTKIVEKANTPSVPDITGDIYCDRAGNGFDGAVKVAETNVDYLKGYYYVYNPVDGIGEDGLYYDPFGDLIGDGTTVGYNTSIPDAGKMFYTLEMGYEPAEGITLEEAKQHIDINFEPIFENPDVNGGVEYQIEGEPLAFYIDTYVDDDTVVIEDDAEGNKIITSYVVEADPSYKKINPDESYFVYAAYEPSAEVHTLADFRKTFGCKEIYPRYAEEKVILGLDTNSVIDPASPSKEPLPKADTQIVKTMYEVLKDIANPFDYDINLNPANFKCPKGIADIIKNDIDLNAPGLGLSDFKIEDHHVVIDKSCKINIDNIGANAPDGTTLDGILIDPGPNEIVLVIERLKGKDGGEILIDDSQGGKVHVVIMNGGYFNQDMGQVITTSYKNLFENPANDVIKYQSPNVAGGCDISSLGKKANPSFYIYGEEGSNLNFINMSVMTVNILSPNIQGTIKGGTGALPITSFYYNDLDLMNIGSQINGVTSTKQFLIGSCNAKYVTVPNQLNIIHVTADKGHGGEGDAESEDFWYRILYYDEF